MTSAPATKFDPDDIDTLAEILEAEKRGHLRKRLLCFVMFITTFAALLVVLAVGALQVASLLLAPQGSIELAKEAWIVQTLAALGAASVSFFTTWWGVQNCLNGIERTLFAARARRHHLFEKFLEQIQCVEKKRKLWTELAKGLTG
jgi:hypothetical protein